MKRPSINKAAHQALTGPLEGIVVNQVFESRFGPTLLEAEGDVSTDFANVDVAGLGSLGNGICKLQVRGNRLHVVISIDLPELTPDKKAKARSLSFAADWFASEPDEYRMLDGRRVAVFKLGGWMLTDIAVIGREAGSRDFCTVR